MNRNGPIGPNKQKQQLQSETKTCTCQYLNRSCTSINKKQNRVHKNMNKEDQDRFDIYALVYIINYSEELTFSFLMSLHPSRRPVLWKTSWRSASVTCTWMLPTNLYFPQLNVETQQNHYFQKKKNLESTHFISSSKSYNNKTKTKKLMKKMTKAMLWKVKTHKANP